MTDSSDQEPAAKVVELYTDDADAALLAKGRYRHDGLDELSQTYQHTVDLLAMTEEHESVIRDATGRSYAAIRAQLRRLARDIRQHAIDDYEHAVRWTLDPYYEMEK